MSSSRRPERRFPVRGWPLRTKLIVGVVALLAVACLVIGVVTELFLHSFLVRQLDNQLMPISQVAANGPGGPGGQRQGGGDDPFHHTTYECGTTSSIDSGPVGLPNGSINGQDVGGEITASQLTTQGCLQVLSADEEADLDPGSLLGVPYTREVGTLGDFRLLATRPRGAAPGTLVITGVSLSTVDDTLTSLGFILGGVAAAVLVAAGVTGAVIVRRSLRPLRRVADTASRVAELELDRGDVALSVRVPDADTDPKTEVGLVGAALNRMLGHVAAALAARQASETRVRQFVADASHELRTPLAAIRGYAELSRRSHDDVPPQVAHAMRRVESESNRMTTLVDDLLLLARLDSGRPLESDDVDLSRLVVDAVSDAHIAGPDHAWRLDLPPDPVTVVGDAQRLHQVLANLLTNARTHTPSGTTVTTGLAEDDGFVTLTVTDDGPGIPAALQPEVFERFARGDTSRSRNAGSTGLGLAIVAAVVAAHDGSVDVRSGPGDTVFTVALPRHSSRTGVPQP
jgi:two-component system OmpR family sensor kinase